MIAGITIFCMAIPLFCGYDFSFLRTTPFTNAVISSQAQISYIAFLVSTIPLLIDTLLDFSLVFTNDKEREVYLFSRVPLALTSFLTSIQLVNVQLSPSIPNSDAASMYLAIIYFRIMVTSSIMFKLCITKPSVFTVPMTSFMTFIVCFSTALRIYMFGYNTYFYNFSIYVDYISIILVFLILLYWSIRIFLIETTMNVKLYSCILYMLIFLIALIGTISSFFPAIGNYSATTYLTFTSSQIMVMILMYSFVIIMLTITPGRIARYEAVTHLVRLVTYVYCVYIFTRRICVYIYEFYIHI